MFGAQFIGRGGFQSDVPVMKTGRFHDELGRVAV
jgi:hypothetical protein